MKITIVTLEVFLVCFNKLFYIHSKRPAAAGPITQRLVSALLEDNSLPSKLNMEGGLWCKIIKKYCF